MSLRGHTLFPERRQSRRYLTVKNLAIAGALFVAAFILLSIWNELRPMHSGSAGTLFDSGAPVVESPSPHREPVAIVEEGSTQRRSETRPIVVEPIAAPSAPAAPEKNFEPRKSKLGKGRVTITGDPGGVQMRVEDASKPPLRP